MIGRNMIGLRSLRNRKYLKMPLNKCLQNSLCLILGGLLILSLPLFAKTPEATLEEARMKVKEGDLEKAALLYKQIIDKEPKNNVARKELASVLSEAQLQDPHSETTEAVSGLFNQEAENQDSLTLEAEEAESLGAREE